MKAMQQNSFPREMRNWMPAYVIAIEAATTLLLSIRLLSRLRRTESQPGLDDIFIFIAWLLGVALTVTVLLGSFTVFTVFHHVTISLPGAQESAGMDGIGIYGMSRRKIGLQDGW
jgi:hypothetical protein